MAFPKIIWPSGGGNTLQFVYPPRFVPFRNYKVVRHDNIASSGAKEFVFERRDEFLPFTLEYSKIGADIQAWDSFVLNAIQGNAFDYYADASLAQFTTYTLEDTTWDAAFKSLGLFGFKMVFRKRLGWPTVPSTTLLYNFSDALQTVDPTGSGLGTNWVQYTKPHPTPITDPLAQSSATIAATSYDGANGLVWQTASSGAFNTSERGICFPIFGNVFWNLYG